MDGKKKESSFEKSTHFVKVKEDGSKKETCSFEKNETKTPDKDKIQRKQSLDKESKESTESHFVADISMPEDLPLPISGSDMGHNRKISEKIKDSTESHFVADISMPGDLPLPVSGSDMGHNRHVSEKIAVDKKPSLDTEFEKLSVKQDVDKISQKDVAVHSWASVAAAKPVAVEGVNKDAHFPSNAKDSGIKEIKDASISHDKIVRGPGSIVSLGPVEGKDKCANMQEFEKELALEGKSTNVEKIEAENISKPLSVRNIGIKSLGPVQGGEFSQISGFQKDLTLGEANAERPESIIKGDVSVTQQHADLASIPEAVEKKGMFTRAVESIAGAAGTVVGVFTPKPSTEVPDLSGENKSYEYSENTEIEGGLSGQQDTMVEEKGLVDSAIEKVWNVLTGKEELFPQPEGQQNLQRTEVELEIQAPQQQFAPQENVDYSSQFNSQQQFIPGQEFIPQQGLAYQPLFMNPQEQYLYEQQQLQMEQMLRQQQQQQQMQQQQQFGYLQQQPQFIPQQQMEFINQQQFAPEQQFQNQFVPRQQQFIPPQQQQQTYERQEQQQFDQGQMTQQLSSQGSDGKQFSQMKQFAAQRGIPLQKTVVEEKTVKARITTLSSAGDSAQVQPDYESITQQRREM